MDICNLNESELSDEHKLTRAEKRERFKEYLGVIAECSDVNMVKREVPMSKVIRLSSEEKIEIPQALHLTDTESLLRMIDAWWEDFSEKDGQAGPCMVKLKSVFRGSGIRLSTKPYESADGYLSMEPLANPPSCYSWLPAPPRKIELDEKDVISWERNSRVCLRVLNFVEAILQTWRERSTDAELMEQMRKSVCKAVKCLMQAQVSSMCGQIQVRRDQYLAVIKDVEQENVKKLRHAPVLGETKVFPDWLMYDVDRDVKYAIQDKAFLKAATESRSSFYKLDYKGNYDSYSKFNNNALGGQTDKYQSNGYVEPVKKDKSFVDKPVNKLREPKLLFSGEKKGGLSSLNMSLNQTHVR